MSLSFFSGRTFTAVEAGLALNITSSLVKGLMPLRALVAGLRTVFIDFGYDEALRAAPDFTVQDFTAAAAVILRSTPLPESKSLPAPNPET